MDPRVATRLAEVAGDRAAEAARSLELLVDALCSTPIGVTAIREPAAAWERHVLDALRGVEELDRCPPGALVDVGSGGGVPGLVLGAVRPERELHLVEATARKAEFLRATAALMGVAAVVHAARSEDLARVGAVLRDACAVACARALAAPPAAAELCLPLVAPGGRVILWLGQSADPEDVSVAAAAVAGELRATTTPGLLVLEKVGPTPDRFPRRPGVAAHRPLR
ncbi:MAG: rRNA (guanine527-N7)-methyltransferase [Gaiellales bacterium]|nr:rRNA (guanine527-N7)-methyltransferase [Gaiellales bacterium]